MLYLIWYLQVDVGIHVNNLFSVNVDEQHSNYVYDDSYRPSSSCATCANQKKKYFIERRRLGDFGIGNILESRQIC